MSSVIASNIPSDVSPVKVREFFSFCGKITDLKPLDDNGKVKKYEVVFASPKAVSTALLLSDAELENTFIKVEEVQKLPRAKPDLHQNKEVLLLPPLLLLLQLKRISKRSQY